MTYNINVDYTRNLSINFNNYYENFGIIVVRMNRIISSKRIVGIDTILCIIVRADQYYAQLRRTSANDAPRDLTDNS